MTCTCGKPYDATPAGRHAHRMLEGHTPTPHLDPPPPPRSISPNCERGRHGLCGGGLPGGVACTCTCGHGAWLP